MCACASESASEWVGGMILLVRLSLYLPHMLIHFTVCISMNVNKQYVTTMKILFTRIMNIIELSKNERTSQNV